MSDAGAARTEAARPSRWILVLPASFSPITGITIS